jgi:hypothetical protein
MNKLIVHISGKRILNLKGEELEISKELAKFLVANITNLKVIYEV